MSGKVVPLYCCFGGEFVTTEGKVRYAGGFARVIHVYPAIEYLDLLSKACVVCGSPSTSYLKMKYKYPGFELDRNLVSIDNDEDVCNMIIAFNGSTCSGPLELYLFPNAEISSPTSARSLLEEANLASQGVILSGDETSTACLLDPQNDGVLHCPPKVQTEFDNQDLYKMSCVDLPRLSSTLRNGLEFPDLATLKNAVHEQAICLHFRFKHLRTDPRRYTVRCADKGCSWRMHAVRVGDSSTFQIRSLKEKHTCMPLLDAAHNQATTKWIANFIKANHKEKGEYSIEHIVKDLKTQYGMDVSYNKAWRARKLAGKEIEQNQYDSMGNVGAGNKAGQHKPSTSGKNYIEEDNGSREKASEAHDVLPFVLDKRHHGTVNDIFWEQFLTQRP